MKKYIFIILLTLPFITLSTSHAEEKVITLKDGSALQGEVVGMQDNTYEIQTSNLGNLLISADDVMNISVQSFVPQQQTPQNAALTPANSDLKNQVQSMQNTIMADPAFMGDLEMLVQDPEIQAILTDENFVQDIMSYDQNKIGSNEKTTQLMNNPKMRALMDKMGQKYAE